MDGRKFNVDFHAEQIARNANLICGLPIAILFPVICSVLNVAINCWGQIIRQNQRTFDEGINDLRADYAQRPGDVQRMLSARVFFSANPPVSAVTSRAIAKAMIEHAHDEENREPIKFFLGKSHEQQQ